MVPSLVHDRATCQTAGPTIELLAGEMTSELAAPFIRFDSFDYFLREYFTSKIYADKPDTIQYRENNIGRVITEI